MSEPVAIMIYLKDGDNLKKWLDRFKNLGFYDSDWCEMRSGYCYGEIISFGPCEPLPEEYFQ